MLGLEINYYKLGPNKFSSEHLEKKLDIAHTQLHRDRDGYKNNIFLAATRLVYEAVICYQRS